uniref:Uncharacterized protein LOC104265735 n=1 Tax=Phallusia mammillata TaxID=59560 RepID=A0A6F9DIY0_9ASCI|nr:uncharacterized protein LOC104265735 [Phallusia mammillata]
MNSDTIEEDKGEQLIKLQRLLQESYTQTERLMVSPNNLVSVHTSVRIIHERYRLLVEHITSNSPENEDLVKDLLKRYAEEKTEFDSRVAEWIEKAQPATSPPPQVGSKKSVKSCTSSCPTSASTSSSVRRTEARIKLEMARTKLRQAKERQDEENEENERRKKLLDDERKLRDEERKLRDEEQKLRESERRLTADAEIREVQRQAELAEIEARGWEGKFEAEFVYPSTVERPFVQTVTECPKLAPRCDRQELPKVSHQPPIYATPQYDCQNRNNPTVAQEPRYSSDERFLPRPKIMSFNGDPMEYWTFIRNFEAHVATKVHSDDLRLVYLLQHCDDKVRPKIDHLTKRPVEGYRQARQKLFHEYGQPHIIANACEQHLKKSPRLKGDQPERLMQFADLLEKCLTTLEDIDEYAGLNSLDTMLQLIDKLPYRLQEKWIERSVEVLHRTNREAGFSHFVQFVSERAEVENSLYGSRIMGSRRDKDPGPPMRKPRASAYVVNPVEVRQRPTERPTTSATCLFCGKAHDLSRCFEFKRKTYSERVEFVSRKRLCFRCLTPGHRVRRCKARTACEENDCSSHYHHTLLHRPAPAAKPESPATPVEPQKVASCSVATPGECGYDDVYQCVVPVEVKYEGRKVLTYAFLDIGSTGTFCNQRLIEALGMKGETKEIVLQTLTDEAKEHTAVSVSFSVSPVGGGDDIFLPKVITVGEIPVRPNPILSKEALRGAPHLRDLDFPLIEKGTVTLLIGLDNPDALFIEEMRRGPKGKPFAVKTPFGWTLFGPSLLPCASSRYQVNFVKSRDSSLQKQISSLWETDFGNETAVLDFPTSREDRKTYGIMQKNVKMVEGHYELPLPWRESSACLPDNKPMAERRLTYLKRRLEKDHSLKEKYVSTMQSYLEKGYAREIPREEIESVDGVCWYLPHHPVLHPRKPDKVRVVFDCAAKHKGVSLNDVLMQGPDLVNSLVGVLTRFRKERYALVADIESMFHQIRVTPKDRDALRFLWWPGGDLTNQPTAHQMTVHLFGATSSPSCASFCLKQTALDFGQDFNAQASSVVRRNFYVDDCLTSVASTVEGIQMTKEISDLLSRGGFHLTKWLSNNQKILSKIPEEERSKAVRNKSLSDDVTERVLGVHWNVHEDTFGFKVNLPETAKTRRGLLSALSSLYDPLGFVAPCTLGAKLLLQGLCKRGVGWDDCILESEATQWSEWLGRLPKLHDLCLPRCFKPDDFGDVQSWELHHFADASSVAYGAVCYLRIVDVGSRVHCVFLVGKCRLAPLKTVSIPRLELTAAVLSVKLDEMMRRELGLPVHRSVFWTDSTAVLQSIRNSKKRFPTFVANRIAKIERQSDPSSWRHVPSKLNPADEASRGLTSEALVTTGRWLRGPQFLLESEDHWPVSPIVLPDLPAEFSPVKKQEVSIHMVVEKQTIVERIIHRYSSLHRLKKSIAWLLRYKNFLLSRVRRDKAVVDNRGSLSVEELNAAELELIKYVQRKHFSPELAALEKGSLSKTSVKRHMFKLNPMVVNSVLRVGGRLEKAFIPYDAKHPILLPHSCHFTDLVIERHHRLVGHSGMGHTWSSLRQRFWILKGGVAVRRVIGNCLFCKRRNASAGVQRMADLPSARLHPDEPPFSHVGVDYFGPFPVKQGRSIVKRYGAVFTCLSIRAVHIEVAHSLSTDSFIDALRRFIGRRGNPENIYSDNGTNFVGAERILRESLQSWNQVHIEEYLKQSGIRWSFNPPTASHMGGAWERMVRSIRRILTSLMTQQVVSDETLSTLFVEVESILNSRPLVPVTFDPRDDEPITPNHLLLMRCNSNLPPGLFDKKDCYVRRRWAQVQYLANQFWIRWVREYLPNIISRQKWFQKRRDLQINDVVLVVDDSQPRSKWLMGRVADTFPDKTGTVRSVLVQTRYNRVKRPIAKLCLIVAAESDA